MDKALLIIDMIDEFVYGTLGSKAAQSIVKPISKLLNSARKNGTVIVYKADAHLPEDPELKVWGPHAIKGTPGAEIISELAPQANERVFETRTYSAFYNTKLDDYLKQTGVSTLYLVGVATHICVQHTAADAFFRGYDTIVIEDAVQTFDPDEHLPAIKRMTSLYRSKISTVDDVIKRWDNE